MEFFTKEISIIVAIITAGTTILSSFITIITWKIFENYQNTKKHKRIVIEKLLETKINICKEAIIYYGTYLQYLYSSIYTFRNLEHSDFSILQNERTLELEKLVNKIQLDNNNSHLQLLLFYNLFGKKDEELAELSVNSIKSYIQFVNDNNSDLEIEKKLRNDVIENLEKSIDHIKNKIKIVRKDLNNLMKQ